MRRVIVESPYRAPTYFAQRANVTYARRAVRDCVMRGESPIASHLLFTQPDILRDTVTGEREIGIDAGHAWIDVADAIAVYTDRGISDGMQIAIDAATAAGIPIEYRTLPALAREP
jgi:hypothetical protein